MGTIKRPLLTRRELAAALDAHVRTIAKWELEGLPVAKKGERGKPSLYDEAIARAWVRAHQDETARNRQEVEKARARRESAQAALAEQLAAARAHELLPRADVERAWSSFVSAVRTKMLAWPQTVSDRLARAFTLEGLPGMERVLNDVVRDALRELAGEERTEQPIRPKRRRNVA